MSDWMFDDGSAASLLDQDYGAGSSSSIVEDDPTLQGAPSEDPLYTDAPSEGDEVDPIVVTGSATQTGGGTSGGGDFNWETATSWLDPSAPEDDLPCTPPADPDNTPEGVDMGELRNEARDAANDIRGRDNSVEWGALIYMLNGELFTTDVVSQGSVDSIGFAYGSRDFLPDGAHIVGWIHNHPYDRNRQDGFGADDEAGLDVMAREARNSDGRFTVDDKVMTYTIPNDNDGDASDDPLLEFDEEASRGARGTVVGPCRGS